MPKLEIGNWKFSSKWSVPVNVSKKLIPFDLSCCVVSWLSLSPSPSPLFLHVHAHYSVTDAVTHSHTQLFSEWVTDALTVCLSFAHSPTFNSSPPCYLPSNFFHLYVLSIFFSPLYPLSLPNSSPLLPLFSLSSSHLHLRRLHVRLFLPALRRSHQIRGCLRLRYRRRRPRRSPVRPVRLLWGSRPEPIYFLSAPLYLYLVPQENLIGGYGYTSFRSARQTGNGRGRGHRTQYKATMYTWRRNTLRASGVTTWQVTGLHMTQVDITTSSALQDRLTTCWIWVNIVLDQNRRAQQQQRQQY